MTESTPLSPAAQAVLDAYEKSNNCYREEWGQLAAALRAAADLVTPKNYACEDSVAYFTGHVEWDLGMEARNDTVRENLLAIAAELEGHQ